MKYFALLLVPILAISLCSQCLAEVPAGVFYKVIKSERVESGVCALDIEINKKVDKIGLAGLADHLRNREPVVYEDMCINFYLEGEHLANGAWAVARFSPELKVKVLGLSLEDEKKIMSQSLPIAGEILGQWLNELPHLGSLYTLIRHEKTYSLVRMFPDGRRDISSLMMVSEDGRQSFAEAGDAQEGKSYQITTHGDLEIKIGERELMTLSPVHSH
ncbi:hypothetical protein [Pseudodesulfovibrio piezophilus]|uniref:Lipoprotein n=1 Tax=Pseudodesulfovibrio piezophilus (strain DSM 21447 / JCM 15486 / C1TLV30) TaxID=1322246 RepID=M1WSW6_PSEP2|nr:hypothetical protein [Pseudodesulfovibrio piezophilus]CCH50419.1 exported protein of unknown function [Pseudodesulfovibrio piezophilus C1TLV30]